MWFINNTLRSRVLSDKEIITINRRIDRHEDPENVYSCEDSSSTVYGWSLAYSYLKCWKILLFPNGRYNECLYLTYATSKGKMLKLHRKY